MSEPTTTQNNPPPEPTPSTGAPPPAAETVLTGPRTEQNADLQRKLETEKATRIERERRIAELQDENSRLREIPAPPKPTKRQEKKERTRLTFFDPEEE